MEYFIGPDGKFYISGDMPYGGRKATQPEIDAYLAAATATNDVPRTPQQARRAVLGSLAEALTDEEVNNIFRLAATLNTE